MKAKELEAEGVAPTVIHEEDGELLSGTMNVLLEAMNTIGLDPLHLDIGELTGMHDLLRPLLDQCVQVDNRTAIFQLLDGLNEAKNRGFNYFSVQAVFSH